MLADGRADGLIAIDLDRACRDPRDLEDLIDVVESRSPRVPVESVTGSLRLANDGDITMARVMVAVANKASRDTGRRVASSHMHRATGGQFRGGPRPFGFEPDGTTLIPSEAAPRFRTRRKLSSMAGHSTASSQTSANGAYQPRPERNGAYAACEAYCSANATRASPSTRARKPVPRTGLPSWMKTSGERLWRC